MSEYYIIGRNQTVAAISSADITCSVVVAGVTYVYWRHSTVGPSDNTSVIKMSSSTDLKTWSAAVTVWSQAGFDVRPAGVVNAVGNVQTMLVAEVNTTTGAVTTRKIQSTSGGTGWASLGTTTFTEYWAHPMDLTYNGTLYYLCATVQLSAGGPMISLVKSSPDLNTWTSLGYVSQQTTRDNVWCKIAVAGSTVHLVHREGNFSNTSGDDRILYSRFTSAGWGYITEIVKGGTGNPDIAALSDGYAVIYKDQSVMGGTGIWSWVHYDAANHVFAKRGTFSQNFEYGVGGSVMPTTDGFTAVYSTRAAEGSTIGTLYLRHFTDTVDQPPGNFVPRLLENQPEETDELDNFHFEISYGQGWVSLSDGYRFYLSPENFGSKAQQHRRITAQSPYYDGTYLIHAVKENVQESLVVNVLGVSQNDVTENLLLLEEMVTQPSFRMRMMMGDHAETWDCQLADYTIERGHIMMHNQRAIMRLSVPRLPEVTYEVI